MRSIRPVLLAVMVIALAVLGSGGASAISTPTTSSGLRAAIFPSDGRMVGIAQPVTVEFAEAVTDRVRAERSVHVTADGPLPGTFSWTGESTLTWTPTGMLPTDSLISVRAGAARTEFRTNAGVYAEADMSAHTFTVSIGGQVARTMPASMGKPGWETPTGTFPVLEKFRSIVFDSRTIGIPLESSEGYLIDGEYAERLTWGGVFVHSAPWSVDSQGYANVSHGCINLSPEDAAWYYNTVGIGDPVYIHW
ncbi:L,D-transpeptidase [Nocardia higoensis]|uniref:L,D-transpeptidase n=1 Tax=Nocardia higoensis TaxID=228599 RepID=A0ABS0D6U1_9NOCA|nr:L,D-transpeptidase [Nocardia higoensis]MBF6354207.1 L,D-transpeptidase [Nocardia higoensis]